VGRVAVPPKRTGATPVILDEMAPLPISVVTHLPVPVTRPPRVTLIVKVAFPVVRVVWPNSLELPLMTPLPIQVPAGKAGLAAASFAGAGQRERGKKRRSGDAAVRGLLVSQDLSSRIRCGCMAELPMVPAETCAPLLADA
jgi:hypothetical protein